MSAKPESDDQEAACLVRSNVLCIVSAVHDHNRVSVFAAHSEDAVCRYAQQQPWPSARHAWQLPEPTAPS
jgi:hypothetical protein